MVAITRTLARGATGADVIEWQKIVSAPQTGVFDDATVLATKAWQKVRGLKDDAIVGPITRAAAEEEAAAPTDPAPPMPSMRFLQAEHHRKGRRHPLTGQPCGIDIICAHAMQAVEKPNTAENVAAWFNKGNPIGGGKKLVGSAHLCCDVDSIVETVREYDTAFGAAGANHNGYHVEFAGFAEQKAAEWDDAYSCAMIRLSAAPVARIVRVHSVPLVVLDAEALVREERGFTTHYQITLATRLAKKRGLTKSPFYKAGGDHVDPGPGWPMGRWLELIQEALDS